MSVEYRPRIVFEVSQEQKDRADRLLETYGLRKAIFGIILDDLLDLIEEHGGFALGAILASKVKPKEVIPSMRRIKDG